MGIDFLNYNTRQLETPCYILDVEHLDRIADDLQRGFCSGWNGKVIIGYSVKTNSLPWIITHLKKKGFYAEVVSEQEYRLVKRLGFKENEIILNGPVKTGKVLIDALNGGAIVNLDNNSEIEYLVAQLKSAKGLWKVGLRYNYLLEDDCPGETIVGPEHSRFGFCVENGEFGEIVAKLGKMPEFRIVGLHGHNSTKSKSLDVFRSIARKASWLVKEYGLDLEYLDIGGGIFGDKPGKPTFKAYAEAIAEAYDGDPGTALIIEPGASVISSPISYLCEVENIKNVNEKRFVTVNGSRIHIDPLMHGIQFVKKIHDYEEGKRNQHVITEQVLCGFTCIEMDRLGIINNQKELQIGDRIQFMNCGSYSMTLAPLFISYFPIVYAHEKNEYQIIRYAWDESDFIRKSEVSL